MCLRVTAGKKKSKMIGYLRTLCTVATDVRTSRSDTVYLRVPEMLVWWMLGRLPASRRQYLNVLRSKKIVSVPSVNSRVSDIFKFLCRVKRFARYQKHMGLAFSISVNIIITLTLSDNLNEDNREAVNYL